MTNNKGFILVIVSCLIVTIILIGTLVIMWGKTQNTYTAKENELIDRAIEIVNKKYGTNIIKKNYSFSVGIQISDNQFVKIDSQEDSKNTDIISVSALSKKATPTDEPTEFSIIFNNTTNEIIEINLKK